jgi:hypothetical protein
MAKSVADNADNGKPVKAERAPVIRTVFNEGEDMRSRVLNRYVPAWIASVAFTLRSLDWLFC